ncbi:hypothetical protein DFQ28_008641 [Apophysomyces sp. BC1034]|nr:hypothetical protein DFQ30_006840 [Apophysomyces sp. BC1015]KAG0176667.1 hypothetical protein DFQ29_005842 [Apophysomyces sp. BC1021]KAG0185875.1 hypothetical protein DFQ28_008641 [Apophysomyces sp. BC1034]
MTEPDIIVIDPPSPPDESPAQSQEDMNNDVFAQSSEQNEQSSTGSAKQTPLIELEESAAPTEIVASVQPKNLTKAVAKKKSTNTSTSKKATDESGSEEEYEIEKFLGHKIYRGMVVKYHVKWKGYSDAYNTFEPATMIHEDCPDLCADYWAQHEPRPSNAPRSKKRKIHTTTTETTETAIPQRNYDLLHHKYEQLARDKGIVQDDLSMTYRSQGFVLGYGVDWPLSDTNWETDLRDIHTVQYTQRQQELMAYVSW